MTLREKAEEMVRYLDGKYRRVHSDDVAVVTDMKSGDIVEGILSQVTKRKKGQYELTGLYYPEYDDADQDEIDDSLLDAAIEDFDRVIAEVMGDPKAWWLVSEADPEYDSECLGLYFISEQPSATVEG